MWVFIRNAVLHKTHSWVREAMLVQEWARRFTGFMCILSLQSCSVCWTRNVHRKWPSWANKVLVVLLFLCPVVKSGVASWSDVKLAMSRFIDLVSNLHPNCEGRDKGGGGWWGPASLGCRHLLTGLCLEPGSLSWWGGDTALTTRSTLCGFAQQLW